MHAVPVRIKAQPWRLSFSSALTNFDSNRRAVKLFCLSFIFLGDTVMLDYVMFFRCNFFWNKSLRCLIPATAVCMPRRQSQALLSGEKLSGLVPIWLIVYSFCSVLENCCLKLSGVATGPWTTLRVFQCKHQIEFVDSGLRVLSNYAFSHTKSFVCFEFEFFNK